MEYLVLQAGTTEAAQAIVTALTDPFNILLLFIATIIGLIMGIIPGLGGIVAITLLIPFTYSMDPLIGMMVLSAVLGGCTFGGSVTAILLNTPGQSTNAATLLDGYPLTQQGRAGEAIGASAAASMFGAILGVIILIISIPIMHELVLLVSQPEIFWLGVWGIAVVSVVVRGSVITGLISGCIGFLLAMHGTSHVTAGLRWTYDSVHFEGGINLVPVLIGLFALGEMANLVSKGSNIADDQAGQIGAGKWKGAKSIFKNKMLFLRSSMTGTILGMVPGVGGATANFVAYFQAKNYVSDPEKLGTGDIRGVIAAEAANDAKDGGAYIPTLALGIPGSASMAVLLGAFSLHGFTPGPVFFEENLEIVMIIIAALLLSNVITSMLGIVFAEQLSKVTQINIHIIAAIVIPVSFLGTFAVNNSFFDVFITVIFGILGFVMIRTNVSRVPLVLALVLAPIIEKNFFRSLQISGGDYMVFVRSPLAILLILLIAYSLAAPYLSGERLKMLKQGIE